MMSPTATGTHNCKSPDHLRTPSILRAADDALGKGRNRPTSLPSSNMETEFLLLPTPMAQQQLLHKYIPPAGQQQQRGGNVASSSAGRFTPRHGTSTRMPTQNGQSSSSSHQPITLASGAAGAVLGFFLGGPFVAAMTGISSAYCATATGSIETPGVAGNVARALGDVALVAHDKAMKVHQRHNLVDGTKRALSRAWYKTREWDRQHRIWGAVKTVSVWSCKTLVSGVGGGLGYVMQCAATIGKCGSNQQETALYHAQIH